MPLSHRELTTVTRFWHLHRRRSLRSCSGYRTPQQGSSPGRENMSGACHSYCVMICTGWMFNGGCSSSWLRQYIVVFTTELHRTSSTTACRSPRSRAASICDLRVAVNLLFHMFVEAPLELALLPPQAQQFGTRCLTVCGDPAVGPDKFRRDLKTYLFTRSCDSFTAH